MNQRLLSVYHNFSNVFVRAASVHEEVLALQTSRVSHF